MIDFEEVRDTCDLSICRQCVHWTEYQIMPGDDPNQAGECNNFTKPDECPAFQNELNKVCNYEI